MIFVLASAFVGFHGWPQVGDAPSPVAVSLSRTASHAGSPAQRALLKASAPAAARSARHLIASRGAGAGALAAGGGASGQARLGSGHTVGNPATPSGSIPVPSGNGTPPPQQCSGSSCNPSSGTGSGPVAGTVNKVVSTAGSALTSAVNTVTQHLPAGGGVVSKGSGAVGSTVTKVRHKLPSVGSSAGLP